MSSPWDGMSGQPCGPPEWPRRGGILRQDARLVEAVALLRGEWSHVSRKREQLPAKRG
jgi:hypothetical protein